MAGKTVKTDAFILLVLCLVLFFSCLGKMPFWDPDEGRYAEIPREMNELHDYVTPRLNTTKYLEKPPLFYWLTAASFKMFGEKEWAGRLIPACAGTFGVFLVYFFVSALADRKMAFYSSCILATNLEYFVMSRVLIIDMLFSVCMSAALIFFYAGVSRHEKQKFCFFWFYVFLALSVLSKGPVALILCGMVVFFFLLLTRQIKMLAPLLSCLSGILSFLAIVMPWFVLVSRHNKEFLWFFFVHEHYLRYFTNEARRYEPPYFFAAILPLAFWPWFVYIPGTFMFSVRRLFSKIPPSVPNDFIAFNALWFALIFLFFSVSKSKLPTYILPVFFPMSILTAAFFASEEEKSRTFCRAVLAINMLFYAALIIVLFHLLSSGKYDVFEGGLVYRVAFTSLVIVFSCLFIAFALLHRRTEKIFFVTCVSSFIFLMSLISLAEPLSPYYSDEQLSTALRPLLKKEDMVVSFRQYHQTMNFYIKRRLSLIQTTSELEVEYTDEKTKPYFLDTIEDFKTLLDGGRVFCFVPIKEMNNFFLFYPRGAKLFYVARGKDTILFSNEKVVLKESGTFNEQ